MFSQEQQRYLLDQMRVVQDNVVEGVTSTKGMEYEDEILMVNRIIDLLLPPLVGVDTTNPDACRRAWEVMSREDPDGWSTKPTEEDYKNFHLWATTTYGEELWRKYRKSGWRANPEV